MRKIRLRASFDTFIKDRNSYLFGLSDPQTLDSYRLETPSGLRANETLSPAYTTVSSRIKLLYESKYPISRFTEVLSVLGLTTGGVRTRMSRDNYLYPSGRMTGGGFESPIPIRPDDGWGAFYY